MAGTDWLLAAARWLLRLVLVLNYVFAAAFAVGLIVSVPYGHLFEGRIEAKYGGAVDAAHTLMATRALLLLGLLAVAVAWVIATRLLEMIRTVAEGAPFSSANARRLTELGWAMLAWQALDLAVGGMTLWLAHLGVDHFDWAPSLTGWVVTVMVFVLARIFTHGAAMSEELAATV